MSYDNLPGVISNKTDGNLAPEPQARAPRVIIIGTAGKGRGDQFYRPASTTVAKSEWGSDGTLLRGIYETRAAGAEEVAGYRIGADPAVLTGIGDATGAAGYTISTVDTDASAGGLYQIFYDDSADHIRVTRVSDDLIVYDNVSEIDRYYVTVSGYRATAGGSDIGTLNNPTTMSSVNATGTTYTAGADGLTLSRMEMYEELYVAYKNLMQSEFDVVIPMDVYLDDFNVIDQGNYLGAITPVVPYGQIYPTAGANQPGTDVDSLGKVYVEEYEGQYYFWWWFNDGTGTFAGADIYPSIGSADASHAVDGTALDADDFHEVNFAYQLARFLYDYSTYIVEATGVIGVRPPENNTLSDKARWLGQEPTFTLNTSTSEYYISIDSNDGSGLLGNKFMVGKAAHRSGEYGGGFIAADGGEFIDSGSEELDSNDQPVDIGKYISVVIDWPLLRNNFSTSSYISSIAASYGGFYSNMIPSSAPTNKKMQSLALIYKLSLSNLDSLVKWGYVTLRQKPQGLVITDAPMATLPNSDWRRLSTVRIIKAVVDGIRDVADPFIGEGVNSTSRAALHTAVENVLLAAKKAGYIQDFREFEIYQTLDMEVAGTATIDLTIKPAFELRQITVTVSLTKTA